MAKTVGTTGTGITSKSVVEFDLEDPADVGAVLKAAVSHVASLSFAGTSRRIEEQACGILKEAGLPEQLERYFGEGFPGGNAWNNCLRQVGDVICRDGFLSLVRSRQGDDAVLRKFAIDTPPGYAVRMLVRLAGIREAMARGDSDASALWALETGMLLQEAIYKEAWEPHAMLGAKVADGARSGGRMRRESTRGEAEQRVQAFEAERRKGTGIKAAYEKAATACSCSPKTVQRAVRDAKKTEDRSRHMSSPAT